MIRSLPAILAVTWLTACGSGDKKEEALASAPAVSDCPVAKPAAVLEASAVAPRYLIKLKGGPRASALHGGKRIAPNLYLVDNPEARTAREMRVATAAASGDVEYVEPDFEVRTTLATNDPDLARQWAHSTVQSAEAWGISRGSSDVIVAILDTGADITHEDLAANVWTNRGEVAGNGRDDDGNGYVDDLHGWNFVDDNNNVTADDAHFHGTHVAGTIGAVGNNGKGISGHAQVVKLMPLKFLGANGSGSTSNAIRAIDYAIAKGAKIISNSWGSTGRSQALEDAIGRAEAAGILFVAAAGNNGTNNSVTGFYPANSAHDNVISVAASTSADRLASFSDYGALVHLAAPGSSIYSLKNGNGYQTMSGTSMATPLVSGVLATMIARRPDLDYRQIKGALLSSVDEIAAMKDKVRWNGRINAYRALATVDAIPGGWRPPAAPDHLCP